MSKEVLELTDIEFRHMLNEELSEDLYYEMREEGNNPFIKDYDLNGEIYFHIEDEMTWNEGRYVEREVIIKRFSDAKYFRGDYNDWGNGDLNITGNFTEVERIETTTYTYV